MFRFPKTNEDLDLVVAGFFQGSLQGRLTVMYRCLPAAPTHLTLSLWSASSVANREVGGSSFPLASQRGRAIHMLLAGFHGA